MNDKLQEQARAYAEEKYPQIDTDDMDIQANWIRNTVIAEHAYRAGAESRQAEIDELKNVISRHISTINEYEKWEVIQHREIEELKEALREAMANVDVEVRLPKAEQILKKYEK